jgi:putative transposase
LVWNLNDDSKEIAFLIQDNDKKFSLPFDNVFSSEKIEIIHTPFHAPRANAFAERWVRSVREECLDQILILNENHLQRVLKEHDQYYNHARSHQGIGHRFPVFVPGRIQNRNGPIRRRKLLGGIILDYQRRPSSQIYSHG